MPYRVPTFNILCNIYTMVSYSANDAVQRLVFQPCSLSPGRRTMETTGFTSPIGTYPSFKLSMELLMPALTDIRSSVCGGFPDVVEVPAGSGRYYTVSWVDDVGKGYANEYRLILMSAVDSRNEYFTDFPDWPTPIP